MQKLPMHIDLFEMDGLCFMKTELELGNQELATARNA
jgi:hypothetical protein